MFFPGELDTGGGDCTTTSSACLFLSCPYALPLPLLPGPQLSEEELIAQLRFEAVLLNGIQRSWSAQMVVDLGATLRDPDPEDLGEFVVSDYLRARQGRR